MDTWPVAFLGITITVLIIPISFVFGLVVSLFRSNNETLLWGTILLVIGTVIEFISTGLYSMDKNAIIDWLMIAAVGLVALLFGIIIRNLAYIVTHKGKIRNANSRK